MEIAGEEPYKVIDRSVGALVWVRRRNGSWWPGRILSPDELPVGCLSTPRAGTPVKLLGREDASVDWYNLEKSKRIKAFRCGEYDDCIEKAKALASNLSKKAVKYARREDAILHALRLEAARLEKDSSDTSTRHETQEEDQHLQDNEEQSEEDNDNHALSSCLEDGANSAPEPSQSVVSFEEPRNCLDSKRRRTPNDSEDDDGAGKVIKRMRGLEDLGMGVDFERRKRSQVGHGPEFFKKKNRRRTLSKVLERTPMVFVPVASEHLSSPTVLESHESNRINNNNSDSTNGVSCEKGVQLDVSGNGEDESSLGSKGKENEISSVVGVCEDDEACERLFDVPLGDEDNQECGADFSETIPVQSQKAQAGAVPYSSQSSHVETPSLGHEEHNETGSTGSGPANIHNISQTTEEDTSKWKLKGKRNSRPRKIDIDGEADTYADIRSKRIGGPLLISDVDGLNCESRAHMKETYAEEFRSWNWNNAASLQRDKLLDAVAPPRLLPYRQSRSTVNPKYESSNFSLSHHTGNNSGKPSASLYDVNVEAETSHRPRHVPYISLMSKLNGKPVAGHPLSVEVLADGYLGSECYNSCSELEHKDPQCYTRPSERKLRRQPPSKRRSKSKSMRNGVLSKKIRKLSSLSGSQRRTEQKKKPVLESSLKGPSVACIPLKVVFSRINASLNSSVRPCTTSGT